jgi:amino acid transporter
MLSPAKSAPLASWVTGWFNLLGQVAVTTGIRCAHTLPISGERRRHGLTGSCSFACANFISTASTLGTDYVPTPGKTIGIYAAILVSQGLINSFGVRSLRMLNNISIGWHAIGTTALVIAVIAAAPSHQSAKFVFATFIDGTGVGGAPGWSERASPAYVAIIGILMAQYTLTGFDASAHVRPFASPPSVCRTLTGTRQMTEETHNAAVAGPLGIIMAIGVSAVLGWFLIIGLLFSIQDYDAVVGTATGQPITQIFLDAVGEKGAIVLMVIVIGAMYFCGCVAWYCSCLVLWC